MDGMGSIQVHHDKKDTLVGSSVLLDTHDLDTHHITKSPRQGLHTGMVVVHHLAEVEAHTGILMLLWKKGSSASYAPGSQFRSLTRLKKELVSSENVS